MTRFRIVASRPADLPNSGDFEVVILEGTLSPGQQFRVYEAGHWIPCKIVTASSVGDIIRLRCRVYGGIHWENQYAPAIVDTEAQGQSAFRYIHDE